MKRALRAVVVLLWVLGFSSCSLVLGFIFPDEFSVAGSTYDVEELLVYEWGQNSGTFSWDLDLVLLTSGINWSATGLFSGAGSVLYLDLNSPSSSFESGEYRWATSRTNFSLVDGYVVTNAVYDGAGNRSSQAVYGVTGGVVRVRIPFSLLDDIVVEVDVQTTGGQLEGRYRGPISDVLADPNWLPSAR